MIGVYYTVFSTGALWAGDTSRLGASLHYANAECFGTVWRSTEKPERFVFTSLQPDIVRIDERGRIAALKPGIATVRVISQGTLGELAVLVEPYMRSLQIIGPRTAKIGDTVTVTVEAFDREGRLIPEPTLDWMTLTWIDMFGPRTIPMLPGSMTHRGRFVIYARGTYTITSSALHREHTGAPTATWTLSVP
jgi:hypothetical protein